MLHTMLTESALGLTSPKFGVLQFSLGVRLQWVGSSGCETAASAGQLGQFKDISPCINMSLVRSLTLVSWNLVHAIFVLRLFV